MFIFRSEDFFSCLCLNLLALLTSDLSQIVRAASWWDIQAQAGSVPWTSSAQVCWLSVAMFFLFWVSGPGRRLVSDQDSGGCSGS